MSIILTSFLLGFLGSWIVLKYGGRIGAIDIPTSRSSHFGKVPKGGGFGILAAFVLLSLILEIPIWIWIPAVIMSLISFWGGDKHCLSVKQRLLIHFGCSLFFSIFFLYSKQFGFGSYMICLPISVFIVGTANFYNFMDGIDGIAGITGFIGFSLMAFYGRISGMDPVYGVLSLSMAFACLGFLCFNFPKAKIFLGDVGSILLGFLFACLIIVLSEDLVDFFVMAGFLAPFYFDEIFTMIFRIRDRDSLITPHRKHIYQILVNEARVGHCKVSLGYGLLQLIIGVSAIFIKPAGLFFLLGTYLIYGLIFTCFSIMIRRKFPLNEN
nr:UDP-N-acetylmuramyl pentapeptide phosphotransferase [Desulfobacula sp.]